MKQANNTMNKNENNRRLYYIVGAVWLLICLVLGVAAWTAASNPVFASMLYPAPASTPESLWAQVDIDKPSVVYLNAGGVPQANSADNSAFQEILPAPDTDSGLTLNLLSVPTEAQVESYASAPDNKPASTSEPILSEAFQVDVPTATPSELPADTPVSPTDLPTSTPEPIETPAQLAMDIIPNTPTSAYAPPTSSGSQQSYASAGNGVRWIDVDLSNQRVYAYEGDVMINSFLVSTGTWATPTVTGQYRVYVKYGSATMSGPGYYLPNVPYVMYFYKGYGLHGTYWHNNFGTPMSHGCVNLRTDDAGWLFN
jgi:lipoprotein-anchoring transpeptidase ErfK/SrfK